MISYTIFGKPQPQGSARAFVPKGWKRAIITSANPNLKQWRQQATSAAMEAMQEASMLEPVDRSVAIAIQADFYFDKPASTKRSVVDKVTKPDIDKLQRGLFDSMTGVVFVDDSQIVRVACTKNFGSPERVEVSVKLIIR